MLLLYFGMHLTDEKTEELFSIFKFIEKYYRIRIFRQFAQFVTDALAEQILTVWICLPSK
jgi:hypothetical protein